MFSRPAPRWMSSVLVCAGVYNLVWGGLTIFLPRMMYRLGGMDTAPGKELVDVELWQCIGMIVGVYGVGYAVAARDPLRHWPVVLVGFLGKLFGPIGVLQAVLAGRLAATAFVTNVFNDLIWLGPFGYILLAAYQASLVEANAAPATPLAELLQDARTRDGRSLDALSRSKPTLVVFLRHFGCTFCREALADLAALRADIEANGAQLAFVHMGTAEQGDEFFKGYGLAGVPHFSDPECKLCRALGLRRAHVGVFLRPILYRRGYEAFRAGHGIGKLVGDGFRMPGVFLIQDGVVVRSFRHVEPSDRPDYRSLAACSVPVATAAAAP